MTGPLSDQSVLVIGRAGGLAGAAALAARDAGARVTVAGRHADALATAYAGEPGISAEMVGTLAVAITNGAADVLARSLALELAPIRVNAISPGVIDTGAWDALGEQGKADYFAGLSARNPARRIGTVQDIANAVLFAMTSTFLTGQTLHVDGGEPLT